MILISRCLTSKETLDVNIPWSNAFVEENATIEPIMNAIMPTKAMVHILK